MHARLDQRHRGAIANKDLELSVLDNGGAKNGFLVVQEPEGDAVFKEGMDPTVWLSLISLHETPGNKNGSDKNRRLRREIKASCRLGLQFLDHFSFYLFLLTLLKYRIQLVGDGYG